MNNKENDVLKPQDKKKEQKSNNKHEYFTINNVFLVITALLIFIVLFIISNSNYLLFHSIAEFFSIIIAFSIFLIAWNSRHILDNYYFLFLGIAFLFIGGIDFIHTLSYKGMGVFPEISTNIATQLWIAARYLQSLSFLAAFIFIKRKFNSKYLFSIFFFISTIIIISIFYWMDFPEAFHEGTGLTFFKIISEYIISFLFLISIYLLLRYSKYFNHTVRNYLIFSLLLAIGGEMAFTLYQDPYGFFNVIGHFLKIISFYFIYKALIEIGLSKPTELLFHNLKQSERNLDAQSKQLRKLNLKLQKEIEQRIKIENALKKQEERYHSTLDNMMEGCQIIDFNWRFIYLNDAAVQHAKKNREELIGHTMMESFPDIKKTKMFQQLKKSMINRESYQMENEFFYQDGTKKWFELSIQPVPEGLFILSQDITERKEIERRYHQINSQLISINKELEAFSYSISHDLQAPLRALNGFSEILLEDYEEKLDQDGKEYLNRIKKAANRMGELIDALLRLSRINRSDLQIESVDLSHIAREIIGRLRQENPNRKIDVKIQDNIIENCDRKLIEILLRNLLENAWKYTSKTKNASIEFGKKKEKNNEILYIKDNGAGFDMSYIDNLFKPFQRLHTDKDFSGTGIGLSIVQRIIQRHMGKIWAEGKEGEGAIFYFILERKNGD